MTVNADLFQLVIRGKLNRSNLDEVRNIHNETAGNPQGVAAARALGDLSHNVFVPYGDDPSVATELLFLDSWNSIEGMGKFFADPQVQAGAGMIFATRDPVIGTPAGTPGYCLHAPKDRPQRFVGLLRGTVKSREATNAYLAQYTKAINSMRTNGGLVSHQMFYRLAEPGQPASNELIGIDVWHDGEGMQKMYSSDTSSFHDLFTAKPVTSTWKQPGGHWVEW
jgi:hypothetical protein